VQGLELVLLVGSVFIAVAYVTVLSGRRGHAANPGTGFVLGIVPGLLGVTVVLVNVLDFIPDDLEGILLGVVIFTISVLAIVGTRYRMAR
jgi:hypothetical protein